VEKVKLVLSQLPVQDLHPPEVQDLQLERLIGTRPEVRAKDQLNQETEDLVRLEQKQKVQNVNTYFWYLCA
jgi:hypothetical protein